MGQRKRASMREGPLAALFRSTAEKREPEREEERQPLDPQRPPGQEAGPAPPPGPAPPSVPAPKERLSQVFSTDLPADMLERPAYGREEPSVSSALTAPRVHRPVLRVVGVGGAGVNAVNRMVEAEIEGVEFMAVNTDLQSLQQSAANITLHIGAELTHGLGTGSDPEVGYQAAFQEADKIKRLLKGSDMVFIAAGAGGGTGTGAAPVVARIAREIGALTVGIVTKPFGFEGTKRASAAEDGVAKLADALDTLIVIPNNRLLAVLDRNTSMMEAFRVADDVLRQGVQGISDLITLPGLINLDFADVRTIMTDAGQALLGIGMAIGESRAVEAAEKAVSSPLLETSVDGARSILLSITGGRDLSLVEVSDAARTVQQAAHPDANIIFGASIDEGLEEQCWVTVVATGFDERARRAAQIQIRREPVAEQRRRERVGELGTLEVPEFIPGG